jgi:hypothetical protein
MNGTQSQVRPDQGVQATRSSVGPRLVRFEMLISGAY